MEQKYSFTARPNIFSRNSLELTFQLLRQQNFSLALEIQNQLQGTKLPYVAYRESEQQQNVDHFRISLDAHTIGRVVDALTSLGENYLKHPSQQPDRIAMLSILIKDWIALGEWLITHAEPPSHTVH